MKLTRECNLLYHKVFNFVTYFNILKKLQYYFSLDLNIYIPSRGLYSRKLFVPHPVSSKKIGESEDCGRKKRTREKSNESLNAVRVKHN